MADYRLECTRCGERLDEYGSTNDPVEALAMCRRAQWETVHAGRVDVTAAGLVNRVRFRRANKGQL